MAFYVLNRRGAKRRVRIDHRRPGCDGAIEILPREVMMAAADRVHQLVRDVVRHGPLKLRQVRRRSKLIDKAEPVLTDVGDADRIRDAGIRRVRDDADCMLRCDFGVRRQRDRNARQLVRMINILNDCLLKRSLLRRGRYAAEVFGDRRAIIPRLRGPRCQRSRLGIRPRSHVDKSRDRSLQIRIRRRGIDRRDARRERARNLSDDLRSR